MLGFNAEMFVLGIMFASGVSNPNAWVFVLGIIFASDAGPGPPDSAIISSSSRSFSWPSLSSTRKQLCEGDIEQSS